MDMPRVQIVDSHDKPIGGATKKEAFEKGLIRRIVRGITQDETRRLLLHKRAPHKQPNPNKWDWLPSGHVDEGEDYEQALNRETEEELGIGRDAFQFTPIESYYSSREAHGLKLNSFNRVYEITVSSTAPIRLDTSEATELRWFTVAELANNIRENPDQYAPSVLLLFPKYYQ